jgi:hypothetical protein
MDLTGKKLLICEEALIDTGGHFQSWIKAIREMHLEAGATVFVAGSTKVIPQVRDELEVLPVYSVNTWDQSKSSSWPAWRRHLRVLAQNWRIFWETRRALRQTGAVDMVLFTAVRVHQIVGLRALCAWGLGRHFRGLTIFLLTSQAEYSDDFSVCRFPRRTALMAWILKSFGRLVSSGRVILAGDSHITCGEYERLAGVSMTLFPSPADGLRYDRTPSFDRGPVFTMLGVSTWDKGIDVFQEAILRFLERNSNSDARFVLQWRTLCEHPGGKVTQISDRLRTDPRVTLLEHRLSNEEYAHWFRDADVIVLPYRKVTYFNRISGVAIEAAVSGKPIIVTQGTWLSWALHEFAAGLEIPENDANALVAAVEKCCAHRVEMIAEALDRSRTALDYNSSGEYLKKLWPSSTSSVVSRERKPARLG